MAIRSPRARASEGEPWPALVKGTRVWGEFEAYILVNRSKQQKKCESHAWNEV